MYNPNTKRRALDSEELQPMTTEEPITRNSYPETVARESFDVDAVVEAGVNATLSKENASKAGQYSPWDTPIQND